VRGQRRRRCLRFLFLNQFFWPDEAATSQLLYDVACEAAKFADVTVLCGPAQYASSKGSAPPPGVNIRRVQAAGFGHGKLQKLLSYASFAAGATFHVLFGRRPDVVISMTTPPLLGLLGWVAQLRGARHIIWEMDLYPDVAVELGVFSRSGFLDKVTGWLADFPRHRANGIIALGPCMETRLRQRGICTTPIFIVHNWADGASIRPQPFVHDGNLRVFYSGNMGLAHDFETVLPVLTEPGAGILFRFSGGGPRRAELERACAGLPHCSFTGYHAREELEKTFGENDLGLVTQYAATIGTLVPSKVYGILAAGRAVVYVGPAESTVGRLITDFQVGWRVENGDSAGLGRLFTRLQADREAVEATGRRAREVFAAHFDRPGQVNKILAACGLGT
jgi:colanic acid biosynthesis glycosyl transferase WcaI